MFKQISEFNKLETRETRNAIEFDKMNKCYICGMEKNEVNKNIIKIMFIKLNLID